MEEHIFHSELSQEEIERNFADFDFFRSLSESLQEAVEYAKGNPDAKVAVTMRNAKQAYLRCPSLSGGRENEALAGALA